MNFDDCAARWRPRFIRSAVLLGHGIEEAEDVVQTALLKCFNNWEKVVAAENPEAYAFTILKNSLRDEQKRWRRRDIPQANLAALVTSNPDLTLGISVRMALLGMSRTHREMLVLRYYLDLPERETARVLGVAIGTVKSRTSRALDELATNLTIQEHTQ